MPVGETLPHTPPKPEGEVLNALPSGSDPKGSKVLVLLPPPHSIST